MSDCIGPINIIPDNNQVVLLDNNKSITVIDNNCCTNVDITQPVTSVVQVLTGPIGPRGEFPTSGSVSLTGSFNVSGSISANYFYGGSFSGSFTGSFSGSTTDTLQDVTNNGNVTTLPITASSFYGNGLQIVGNATVTGSLTVSGSNTFRNIGPAQFTGSVDILGILNAPDITGSLYGTASWAQNAQTSSNILGGKAPHVPYFITDTTLATSSIYQSGSGTVIINQDNATTANPEALYVWQPSTSSINVISGKGNLNNYLQLNIQNTNQGINASSDVVATANNGSENDNYIDMGINSENYIGFLGGPNDAYLYTHGHDFYIGNINDGYKVYFFNSSSEQPIITLNSDNAEVTGSLYGTASWAEDAINADNATSASYALTASYASNVPATASFAISSSYAITASHALNVPATASYAISASHANNADSALTSVSASHALVADNALAANYAAIAGNGGVTQLIAGAGITLLPPGGQGAVTIVSSGGGGVTIISGSLVTGSFTSTNSYTFNHNLNTRTPIITVFDTNYNQIIPENIQLVDTASAIITFPTLESGFAIGSTGGTTGTALSSSYALFATYADTASFYVETDPIFVTKSASLATTGSNIFKGNQTVTGSLFTTGSNTLIGNTSLTGSLNITGSTLQTGNNTLIGNTVLSGSIGISGSSVIQGTTTMSGSLSISGSTTQIGNNTLIGTTTLTGSIFINGDIIPQASSSFDLGSETSPWRSIYVQSGSISIQSDIPGGIPAVISNANGNVTFAGAGFQLKSGSFVPFEVSSTARTVIRIPNIPANDIGGLSILGSSDGSYQGITNAGGLLHLTSNDGVSSRITSDAFGTAANAAYVGRKARGTAANPLPVQLGDILTRISSIGWTGPDYGFTMSASLTTAPTSIDVVALENYTTSSFGSRFNFYNVPSGSTIRTLSTTIDTTGITIPSSSRFFGTSSWAENALTASYVQNAQTASYVLQAVSSSFVTTASYSVSSSRAISSSFASTASYINSLTQDVVITGSLKVSGSLTEIGNTVLSGSLTLSSGSTLNLNNGFYVNGNLQYNYGQFSSTQTQTGSADTAYSMTFDTTDFSNGVTLVSGSRITIANTGIYNIEFSSQLHTPANQAVDFSIWFAMTGSNIANSNTDFTVEKIAGGGFAVAALNFLTQIASGSYVELKYSKTTLEGQLQAKGIQSTPSRPSTPSVTVTVTQIA